MQKWVEATSLNGIIDLYEARNNKWQFSLWLSFLTLMLALSCYSMINTVSGYIKSPTMTIITTVPVINMSLPDILLCYKGGYNALKMKHTMGLSNDLIKHLANSFNQFAAEMDDNLANELESYLETYKLSLKQFFDSVTFGCEDMIKSRRESTTDQCQNVLHKFVEYYMPSSCLLLKDNGHQDWPSVDHGIHLLLREPNGSHRHMFPEQSSSGFLLDFSKTYIAPTLRNVKIPVNVEADIVLKPTYHKRLRKCYNNTKKETSSNDCFRLCSQRVMKSLCSCVFIVDQLLLRAPLCTISDYRRCFRNEEQKQLFYKRLANCSFLCIPICDEWEYDFTMSISDLGLDHEKSVTTIHVGFDTLQYVLVSYAKFSLYM